MTLPVGEPPVVLPLTVTLSEMFPLDPRTPEPLAVVTEPELAWVTVTHSAATPLPVVLSVDPE